MALFSSILALVLTSLVAAAGWGRPAGTTSDAATRAMAESKSANANLQATVAFNTMGQLEEAIIHYRAATKLQQNWLPATGGLAWILATHADDQIRDPNEAIRLIEPLTQGNRTHPVALDILAAAYAARGEFELAVQTAERAHEIAKAAKMAVADRIAERANLYRQEQPYLESSRTAE